MSDSQIPSTKYHLPIRTRFAPSPTGFVHVGAVRTALFSWLLAQKNGGVFILRIEDTDKVREVEGSIQQIEDSLRWLGINWTEGIDIGGPHAPYLQSERLDIYKEWANKLINNGRAYADPYSKDQLEKFRGDAKANKKPFMYRDYRPDNPPIWNGRQPLRFKSDPKPYKWKDAVMGDLSTGTDAVDDFILIKSDGYPTYNFCHIIDDMIMGITHVLRSQEFIASTPKFLNLYEALQIERPILATLPYVMSIDGQKKLGKRDGAKDILQYKKDGYLPEAMVNFLATLGWNDGTEQEIFTVDELIEKFSLERVQKSPARFDEKRLLWLNGQWIRRLSIDDLYQRVADFWPEAANGADENYKKKILGLAQDRMKTLSDLPMLTSYFFAEPAPDWQLIKNDKFAGKLPTEEIVSLLKTSLDAIAASNFDEDSLQATLNSLLETTGKKPVELFSLIRLAISWAPFSPALNETLAVLGKETVKNRFRSAINVAMQR
jgi:glutamyl-tRNA synthetase